MYKIQISKQFPLGNTDNPNFIYGPPSCNWEREKENVVKVSNLD